jgi:hypothetical protein
MTSIGIESERPDWEDMVVPVQKADMGMVTSQERVTVLTSPWWQPTHRPRSCTVMALFSLPTDMASRARSGGHCTHSALRAVDSR